MGIDIASIDTDFRDEELPYDTMVMKGLSCIPIVGSFIRIFAGAAIDSQIARTKDVPRLIRLIDLKNDYHVCSIARCAMTAVLPIFWNILGVFWVGIAIIHHWQIMENHDVIKELVNTGYRPDLRIN